VKEDNTMEKVMVVRYYSGPGDHAKELARLNAELQNGWRVKIISPMGTGEGGGIAFAIVVLQKMDEVLKDGGNYQHQHRLGMRSDDSRK